MLLTSSCVLLLLLGLCGGGDSVVVGNPSFLPFPSLFLQDVRRDAFNATIRQSYPDSQYWLIEFYAPWCPHCRHFIHDMERIGATFNGDKTSPVHVGRVNCVADAKLCNLFRVEGYPTLKFGSVAQWISGDVTQPQNVEVEHSAEAVYEWVSKQIPGAKFQELAHGRGFAEAFAAMSQNTTGTQRVWKRAQQWDIDMAVAFTFRSIFESMPETWEGKQVLVQFAAMLCRYYPAPSCRSSMCEVHAKLMEMFYSPTSDPLAASAMNETARALERDRQGKELKSSWKMCGKSWDTYDKGEYLMCRGTFPFTRGYSCGLWVLFHSLSVQFHESYEEHIGSIRSFVSHFFPCIECRRHFLRFTERVGRVRSQTDSMLWFWQVHNIVNMRVATLEAMHHDGDPAFPKTLWPSYEQCPECRLPLPDNPKSRSSQADVMQQNVLGNEATFRWDEGAVINLIIQLYARPEQPS